MLSALTLLRHVRLVLSDGHGGDGVTFVVAVKPSVIHVYLLHVLHYLGELLSLILVRHVPLFLL